jgi:hypothetical protein
MPKFYIPMAMRIEGVDTGSGLRFDNADTLLSVYNHGMEVVTCRFRFWNESDGSPVLWPDGLEYRDFELQPKRAFQTVLSAGNWWPDPPGAFRGHGLIETPRLSDVRAWGILADNNFAWSGPGITMALRRDLREQLEWVFPYAASEWNDSGTLLVDYRTGISIQNFDDVAVTGTVKFVISQTYEGAGEEYSSDFTLQSHCGLSGLLHELIDIPLGKEGNVIVNVPNKARLYPFLIITTQNPIWSVGQDFVDQY